MNKIPITVIVPVKNEEKNLARCLEMLSSFSQVMVIDSSSIDNTPEITKQHKAEYYNFQWNGKFPKKRNWALRNLPVKNDWVLFLDADETLTPDIVTEFSEKIRNTRFNGFQITYSNYFMGYQLRYGDKMKKIPMFRKDCGEYERIDEDSWSHLDMEVHEHPVIKGKTGRIKNEIIHNDFKGLEAYIARHNAYSSWESKRYLQLKKSGFNQLNLRQKIKYKLLTLGLLPLIYFIGAYFIKFGFLDGKAGFYLCRFKANYFFQIQTKIKEQRLIDRVQNNRDQRTEIREQRSEQ